jgi:large subunit ribosomal protein L3
MQALIGVKKSQSQRYLENGVRIPVTLIDVKDNWVISHKTNEKDHYQAVQLGFGMKKRANKALLGHAKKGANLEKAPKFLREVRIVDENETFPELGSTLNPSEIFAPGDIVNVSGFSKGKGFQGGVKRYNFRGGPKTHGQSDRHRAPGAIGSGTTPGRVYKGKRMAGNMGNDNVTIENLKIVDVTSDGVLVVKGLVPGIINSLIYVKKVGEDKKFVPLFKDPEVVAAEEAAAKAAEEEAQKEAEAEAKEAPAETEAPAEETVEAAEPAEQPEEPVVTDESADPSTDSGQDAGTEAPAEESKEEVKDGDK